MPTLAAILLILAFAVRPTFGQELPPIFADTPRQPVKAKTVTEFPVNTFLENIAVNERGDIFVTSLEEGKIFRVGTDGKKNEFARIGGKIAGLAFDRKGNLLVTGWAGGKTPSVFRVSPQGKAETLTAVEGAVFLNGITPLAGDRFLIADAYRGAVWEFDAATNKYAVWLEDAALARAVPDHPFPGVNGLKIYKGNLYATNTQQQKVLRIPLLPGNKPGKIEVIAEKVNGDDFAFDTQGNLYVTTHVYNNVIRIAPDGKKAIIAEEREGVTGCTALAFGRGKANETALFVVTNGGMSKPPKEGVQPAKVVRLDVGVPGAKRK